MEGGVKIASSREQVEEYASNILGNRLVTKQTGVVGKTVGNLYVEAGCSIAHEYYLALLVDREADSVLIMVSTEGGMDIEEVAEKTPEAIHKAWVDPLNGLGDEQKAALSEVKAVVEQQQRGSCDNAWREGAKSRGQQLDLRSRDG